MILTTVLIAAHVSALLDDGAALLAEATRAYDLDAAGDLAKNPALLADDSPDALRLRTEIWLLVANLARITYELTPEDDGAARLHLGDIVDDASKNGLDLCERLESDSETFRIKADLIGATIRTKYRAKRFRGAMEEAAAKALELDPNNAEAYVTSAKPYVFAPERHGGDLDEADRLLDKALELEPGLESARLLRAFVLEGREQPDAAREAYGAVLADNSGCRPAAEALKRLDGDTQ